MVVDTDVFLAHYGVKGMRWGIRKGDNKGESREKKGLTSTQRKVLIGAGIAVGVGAVFTASILTKKHLDNRAVKKFMAEVSTNEKLTQTLNNGKKFADDFLAKDVYVPKGTEFHRVAGYLEKSVNSPKYATYTPKDVSRYRKSWETLSGNGETFFKSKFTTVANSKIAGEESAIKMGLELVNSPKIKGSKEFRQALMEWKGNKVIEPKDLPIVVSDFIQFNAGGDWKKGPAKHLFDYMSRNGYIGITDTVDTGMIAQHAVVLFNDSIVKTTSSPLSNSERKIAYAAFSKILNK